MTHSLLEIKKISHRIIVRQEHMWRALKIQKTATDKELAVLSTTPRVVITPRMAKLYLFFLEKAGYVKKEGEHVTVLFQRKTQENILHCEWGGMEERDPHYSAVLGVRKRSVLTLPFVIEETGQTQQDRNICDAVKTMIDSINFYGLLEDLLDALGKGYSVIEMIWGFENNVYQPLDFKWCDPRCFIFNESGDVLHLRNSKDSYGQPLADYKFIVHTPKLKSGKLCRGGLARSSIWFWMLKNYSVNDWANFCESFGIPTKIGKYGPSATPKDKQTLVRALQSLMGGGAGIIPQSMDILFNSSGDVRGNATVFKDLAEYIDKQLSKLILGQTMTSDNGSSQAQAMVHNEIRKDIVISDARKLSETINRDIITPFVYMNFGTHVSVPKLHFITDEAEDLNSLTNTLKSLIPLGLEVSQSQILEKYGLKKPETSQDTFVPKTNTHSKTAKQEKAHNKKEWFRHIDTENVMADSLVKNTPVKEGYYTAIEGVFNTCSSYDDIYQKIPVILKDIMGSNVEHENIVSLTDTLFTAYCNGELQSNILENLNKGQKDG